MADAMTTFQQGADRRARRARFVRHAGGPKARRVNPVLSMVKMPVPWAGTSRAAWLTVKWPSFWAEPNSMHAKNARSEVDALVLNGGIAEMRLMTVRNVPCWAVAPSLTGEMAAVQS